MDNFTATDRIYYNIRQDNIGDFKEYSRTLTSQYIKNSYILACKQTDSVDEKTGKITVTASDKMRATLNSRKKNFYNYLLKSFKRISILAHDEPTTINKMLQLATSIARYEKFLP